VVRPVNDGALVRMAVNRTTSTVTVHVDGVLTNTVAFANPPAELFPVAILWDLATVELTNP
jgi:hypothetical protein